MNIFKKNQGFTLVETVIAITVIGVIGIIMGDVLKRAFDNSTKTTLISNIQQNGASALSVIQDNARFSQFVCIGDLDSVIPTNTDNIPYNAPIITIFKDGRYIRYVLFKENTSTNVNGYIQEDFPIYPEKQTTDTGNDATTALCSYGTAGFKSWNNNTNPHLITNNISISLKNPSITLLTKPVDVQNGNSKVTISLSFSMAAATTAQKRAQDQLGTNNTIDFNTTIQFR